MTTDCQSTPAEGPNRDIPILGWPLQSPIRGIFPAWFWGMMPRLPLQRPRRGRIVAIGATLAFALWVATVVLVYAQSPGGKIEWGADYAKWPLAGGVVLSPSHGNRYYRVYANPRESGAVYRFNAERLRYFDGDGTRTYPVGTILAMESFERTADDKLGAPGPVFLMRKEAAGYDPERGDWRYAMAEPDLKLLGDGKDGHVTQCRVCHAQAQPRDFVFAKDR